MFALIVFDVMEKIIENLKKKYSLMRKDFILINHIKQKFYSFFKEYDQYYFLINLRNYNKCMKIWKSKFKLDSI